MKNRSGFTIVELLIVIVVIAILATISIVAYSGIQQRATNTRIIVTVNQVVKSITGYISTNGSYPSTGVFCIVEGESSCTAGGNAYSTSATLTNNLKTISTLPTSTPDARPEYNGITYVYSSGRTFNGTVQPLAIMYSLRGEQQQCGVSNITNSGSGTMIPSTTGWTTTSYGYTTCVVSISGPNS